MNIERKDILNTICAEQLSWILLLKVTTLVIYAFFSIICIGLPLFNTKWGNSIRVLLLFIGTIVFINGFIFTFTKVIKLWGAKLYVVETDEEFIEAFNILIAEGGSTVLANSVYSIVKYDNAFLNKAPMLDTYKIIRKYDVTDVDSIIADCISTQDFLYEDSGCIIRYTDYKDIRQLIEDGYGVEASDLINDIYENNYGV